MAHFLLISIAFISVQKTGKLPLVVPKNVVIDVNIIMNRGDGPLLPPPEKKLIEDAVPASNPAGEQAGVQEAQPPETAADEKTNTGDPDKGEEHLQQTNDVYAASINGRFLLYHIRIFYKNTRRLAQALIFSGMSNDNRDKVNNTFGTVKLSYEESGLLKDIDIETESVPLKDLLEHINWKAVSQPSSYYLPYRTVNLAIAVKNSAISIGITVQ